MANEKNLTPWKPGVSANPGGRPKLTHEEKILLKLTKPEVARLLNMTCQMTHEEMTAKFSDEKTVAIEKLFIKTILDGLEGDSVKSAEFILNRTVGKPKDNVELTTIKHEVKRLDGTVHV